MNPRRYRMIGFLMLLLPVAIQAQTQTKALAQGGILFQFGTHVDAIGVSTNVAIPIGPTQINYHTLWKFNLRTYGGRKNCWEFRVGLGFLLLGGERKGSIDFHFDPLNHQTNYRRAIGFNYLWYKDDAGTSQLSGGWSYHEGAFSLLLENDVFGGQARDRFRTGIIQLSYRQGDWKYFSNLYIWTGETKGAEWNKEPKVKCPNGYRKLVDLPYGRISHGIWSFGALYNASIINPLTLKLGIDSEQIRHLVQNRVSHDLIWLPKKVKRHTPHYPRLNQLGQPVFNRRDKRPDRFYLQFGSNQAWSD